MMGFSDHCQNVSLFIFFQKIPECLKVRSQTDHWHRALQNIKESRSKHWSQAHEIIPFLEKY